jgi:hypothetical protein
MTIADAPDPYIQAHSPAVEALHPSGYPEQDHLVNEVQHPDIEAAYQEIARCYTCGQTLPEVTG